MSVFTPKIISVSLNPCIDRGIEVPNFTIGAHQVGAQVFRRPAGKAVNLACALGILKIPTMIVGFIGKGQQEYFERYLNRDPVACQLFPVPGRTRENITIFDPVSNVETHIRERGYEVTPADVGKLRKKLAILCRKDTLVAFSGSLPPGLSPEDFIELVQICQMNEARVCIDASGAVLRACRPLGCWMIKPNLSELSEMLEADVRDPDQIITAGRNLKGTVSITVVTVGKEGAYLFSDSLGLRGQVALDPKEVKNTVGCGDALLAGFLASVVEGKSLNDAFAFSLAAATAAAVSITPGTFLPRDIERFLAQAQIQPL